MSDVTKVTRSPEEIINYLKHSVDDLTYILGQAAEQAIAVQLTLTTEKRTELDVDRLRVKLEGAWKLLTPPTIIIPK